MISINLPKFSTSAGIFLLCFFSLQAQASWWWDDGISPPPSYQCDPLCDDIFLDLPFSLSFEAGYADFFQWPDFCFIQNSVTGIAYQSTSFDEGSLESYYVRLAASSFLPYCFPGSNEPLQIEVSAIYVPNTFEESSEIIAPSGSPFGIAVFPQINGAASISAPADLLNTHFNLNVDYWGGEVHLKQPYDLRLVPMCVTPYLSFAYHRVNQRYKIECTGFDSPDFFTASLSEVLKSDTYEIGGGFLNDYFICSKLSFQIGCALLASYAKSRLNGNELFIDTTGTLFPSSASNHANTWNTKFKSSAALYYETKHWVVGAIGRWQYWGYAPGIRNPVINPMNLSAQTTPAHIFSSFVNFYSIGAQLVFRF